jgi:hypothetical protein
LLFTVSIFNFREMNIQAQKINLAKMILETDNPAILEYVKNIFVKAKQQYFWETMPDEQKQEIEKGLSEILRENFKRRYS